MDFDEEGAVRVTASFEEALAGLSAASGRINNNEKIRVRAFIKVKSSPKLTFLFPFNLSTQLFCNNHAIQIAGCKANALKGEK